MKGVTNLSGLTGTVRTLRANSRDAYGIPWANVTRYEPSFTNAAVEFGVDPALLAAMAVIESDSNQHWPGTRNVVTRDDGFGDGLSVGIMQVKPRIWQHLAPDADAYTADGNIRLGAAVMAYAIGRRGSWQKALVTDYFPDDDPNGTTRNAYVKTVTSLMAEIANNTKPEPPKPDPGPQPPISTVDPIRVIVGGDYAPITYGWLADAGLDYYRYGVGHGTQRSTQHTGVDVPIADESPLYSPIAGVVECVGAAGIVRCGQGCGSYRDYTGGSPQQTGNLTIFNEPHGVRLVLGHVSRSLVNVGDVVSPGQRVALSGGMNGPHVHVETSACRNGSYWLTDPVATLRSIMQDQPVPVPGADRVPFDLYASGQNRMTVKADKAMTVHQRANPASPVVGRLAKGETFTALIALPGDDRKLWWLSDRNGRVVWDGTSLVEVIVS